MRTIWARAILSAAVLVIMLPIGAEASPWGQGPESSLNITKLDYYRSEEGDRSFDQILLETYVEQGFTEMWSLGGKLGQGWQTLRSEDMSDSRSGIVDAELFLQRQLFESDGQAGAIQLLYSFETTTRSAVFGTNVDGRDAAIELSGLWGVGNEVAFLTTKGGYRASLGDDADQLRLDLTIGSHTDENSMFLVDVYTTLSVGDADMGGADYDLMTVAPSFVVQVSPRTRIQLGGRVDVWGEGLDKGAGGFLSLWFEQ